MTPKTDNGLQSEERLISLDFFRGFTMFLLIAEWTVLFNAMVDPGLAGTFIHAIGEQFHHHPFEAGGQLGPEVQPLAIALRRGLLRHRVHEHGFVV